MGASSDSGWKVFGNIYVGKIILCCKFGYLDCVYSV